MSQTVAKPAKSVFKNVLLQWETMLIIVFILLMIVNSMLSEYFLDFRGLLSTSSVFMDKSIIVLSMTIILILGEIDISVASIVALSSVIMGIAYSHGLSMPLAMLLCLIVGISCGMINGIIVIKFKRLSSVIITLSTMIIYRGITYVILEDQATGGFPQWYAALGWKEFFGIPYSFIIFVIIAIVFVFLLHFSILGRMIYAIGNNKTASLFSGIKVDKIKLFAFTLSGFMCGIAALILTSRLGSTRPNIALGYELDVITIVILGGVSAYGGKGRLSGTIIAIFLIGYLRYGLGLINVNSQIFLIIIGSLLILSVMLPNIGNDVKKFVLRGNKPSNIKEVQRKQ